MKKVLFLLTSVIVAMGIMCSCTKENEITPEEKQKQEEQQQKQEEEQSKNATLKIALYDETTDKYLSGATATLYNVSDDAMVASIVTNDEGIATFSNLDINKTFYFIMEYGGKKYRSTDNVTIEKGENKIKYTVKTTSLTITVKNSNGNAVSGATVRLYENRLDYSNSKNIIGSSLYTDSKGQVTFYNLSPKTYFFEVINDTQTNEEGTCSKACTEGANLVTTTIKEKVVVVQSGTIVLNNNATGSDAGTYKFVVTNYTTGEKNTYTVSSGYKKTLTGMSLGQYSVYMEQLDGYTFYATDGTQTGNLQNGFTLTFSTNSL